MLLLFLVSGMLIYEAHLEVLNLQACVGLTIYRAIAGISRVSTFVEFLLQIKSYFRHVPNINVEQEA